MPISPQRHELARRSTGAASVSLLWAAQTDTLSVVVLDRANGSFELVVEAAAALDAWADPWQHASTRGLPVAAALAA